MRKVSQECVCGSFFGFAESGGDGHGSGDCGGAVDVGRVMVLVGMLVAMGVKLTSVAILVSLE